MSAGIKGSDVSFATLKASILALALLRTNALTQAQAKVAIRSSFAQGVILKQVMPTYP